MDSSEQASRKLRQLSIIIPLYNEEEGLPALRAALENWLPSLGPAEVEIILVDDGSRDASFEYCSQWAGQVPYVKVISFSRNFGHQVAISAGMRYAGGDAIVVMDSDLQDPLDVIHEMILRYEEGYDVAYGQRIERKSETVFKKGSAWLFYRLMRYCIHKELPLDAGDFRLVSRRCAAALNAMPETHRFLRGMFAWAGFRQIAVPYVRNERLYGDTKYPLKKMIGFAWNAIISFSSFPIRMVSLAGMFFAILGLCAGLYALGSHIADNTVPGWTSLISLLSLLGGMLLVAIGVIGEYVGKIYEEVKARPLYLIKETINFESDC